MEMIVVDMNDALDAAEPITIGVFTFAEFAIEEYYEVGSQDMVQEPGTPAVPAVINREQWQQPVSVDSSILVKSPGGLTAPQLQDQPGQGFCNGERRRYGTDRAESSATCFD